MDVVGDRRNVVLRPIVLGGKAMNKNGTVDVKRRKKSSLRLMAAFASALIVVICALSIISPFTQADDYQHVGEASELTEAYNNGYAGVRLTADISLEDQLVISRNFGIDLDGYTLKVKGIFVYLNDDGTPSEVSITSASVKTGGFIFGCDGERGKSLNEGKLSFYNVDVMYDSGWYYQDSNVPADESKYSNSMITNNAEITFEESSIDKVTFDGDGKVLIKQGVQFTKSQIECNVMTEEAAEYWAPEVGKFQTIVPVEDFKNLTIVTWDGLDWWLVPVYFHGNAQAIMGVTLKTPVEFNDPANPDPAEIGIAIANFGQKIISKESTQIRGVDPLEEPKVGENVVSFSVQVKYTGSQDVVRTLKIYAAYMVEGNETSATIALDGWEKRDYDSAKNIPQWTYDADKQYKNKDALPTEQSFTLIDQYDLKPVLEKVQWDALLVELPKLEKGEYKLEVEYDAWGDYYATSASCRFEVTDTKYVSKLGFGTAQTEDVVFGKAVGDLQNIGTKFDNQHPEFKKDESGQELEKEPVAEDNKLFQVELTGACPVKSYQNCPIVMTFKNGFQGYWDWVSEHNVGTSATVYTDLIFANDRGAGWYWVVNVSDEKYQYDDDSVFFLTMKYELADSQETAAEMKLKFTGKELKEMDGNIVIFAGTGWDPETMPVFRLTETVLGFDKDGLDDDGGYEYDLTEYKLEPYLELEDPRFQLILRDEYNNTEPTLVLPVEILAMIEGNPYYPYVVPEEVSQQFNYPFGGINFKPAKIHVILPNGAGTEREFLYWIVGQGTDMERNNNAGSLVMIDTDYANDDCEILLVAKYGATNEYKVQWFSYDSFLSYDPFDQFGEPDYKHYDTTSVISGYEPKIPADPKSFEFEGFSYDFIGWNTEKDGTGKGITKLTGSEDYYAQFEKTPLKYTVTVKVENGTADPAEVEAVYGDEVWMDGNVLKIGTGAMSVSVALKEAQSTEMYDYKLKSVTIDGKGLDETYIVKGDVTVEVVFEGIIREYTLTYQPGEGTGEPIEKTYEYGTDVTELLGFPQTFAAPEGKKFLGWSDGKIVVTVIQILGDTELMAVYEDEIYKVTFDANGGSGNMDAAMVKYGPYELPECTFVYNGKEFKGWSLTKTGDTVDQIEVTGNTTVYAIWMPVKYTVSFDANGGSGDMDDVIVEYGGYELPECTFIAPEGKEFKGWSLTMEGETVDQIKVTGNTTVYAVWKDIMFTVSFKTNNVDYGTVSTAKLDVPYGTILEIDRNKIMAGNGAVIAEPKSVTGDYFSVFKGWEGVPDDNMVVDDLTITACFELEKALSTDVDVTLKATNQYVKFVIVANDGRAMKGTLTIEVSVTYFDEEFGEYVAEKITLGVTDEDPKGAVFDIDTTVGSSVSIFSIDVMLKDYKDMEMFGSITSVSGTYVGDNGYSDESNIVGISPRA